LQKFPSVLLLAYLALPLRRRFLVGYILGKWHIDFLNLIFISMFVAFAISAFDEFGIGVSWLLLVLAVVLLNGLLVLNIKGLLQDGYRFLGPAGLSLLYCTGILFSELRWNFVSGMLDGLVSGETLFLLMAVVVLAFAYAVSCWTLVGVTYRLSFAERQRLSRIAPPGGAGERWPELAFEWRQMWRNKRVRTVILIQSFMPMMIVYSQIIALASSSSPWSDIMLGGLLTLAFMPVFVLGGFSFATESSYFDRISSIPVDWNKFLWQKFRIISIWIPFFFLLYCPLILVRSDIIYFLISYALFAIGVSTPMILWRATWSKTHFDIGGHSLFNYQGMSTAPFRIEILGMVPISFPPILIIPFALVGLTYIGLLVIGGCGLVSLAFYKRWLCLLQAGIAKRKYERLEGFRQMG